MDPVCDRNMENDDTLLEKSGRIHIHDLYALVGVASPSATDEEIRKAYEAMIKELLPQPPSKVTEAAFSILSNPFMRAQYDRDRLGYLYAHRKGDKVFPVLTTAEEHEARDKQILDYVTGLRRNFRDPVDAKLDQMLERRWQIDKELMEFKVVTTQLVEAWAPSSNSVLRMAANALREVEICARGALDMVGNEVERLLDGDLPLENICAGGPSLRPITAEEYGIKTAAQSPNLSRPIPGVSFWSPPNWEMRDRVIRYLSARGPSPVNYAPSTLLGFEESQHDMLRLVERAKRQSLSPEMLSDLSMVKSASANDRATSSLSKIPEVSREQRQYEPFPAMNSSSGLVLPDQNPPGPGLVEGQNCFGYSGVPEKTKVHNEKEVVGTGSSSSSSSSSCCSTTTSSSGLSKKAGPAKKKLPKSSVHINDSVSMPPHLSSIHVTVRPLADVPPSPIKIEPKIMQDPRLPIARDAVTAPDPALTFQRTRRDSVAAVAAAEIASGPVRRLRAKQGLASISDEIAQQEMRMATNATARSIIRKPLPCKVPGNDVKMTLETRDREAKQRDTDAILLENLKKTIEAAEKTEAEVTASLINLDASRGGGGAFGFQQRGAQEMNNNNNNSNSQIVNTLSSALPQASGKLSNVQEWVSAQQHGVFQPLESQVGGPQQPGFMPYGMSLLEQMQHYNAAQQTAATMYPIVPIGPSTNSNYQLLPTVYDRGAQQGYQTGPHGLTGLNVPSYVEGIPPYGSIGAEITSLREQARQEEAKRMGTLAQEPSASRKDNDDPFVD